MEESRVDSELKAQMAHLDIMEVDESNTGAEADTEDSETPAESGSRVLRKRKSIVPVISKANSRKSLKPRKTINLVSENANRSQIEALYLNKKVKNLTQTLETIYEEPKTETGSNQSMIGTRKVKRLLTFQDHYTKDKIKKRRAKIKKLLGNKTFLNRKKIPMKVFMETIESLGLDDNVVQVQNNASAPIVDKVL